MATTSDEIVPLDAILKVVGEAAEAQPDNATLKGISSDPGDVEVVSTCCQWQIFRVKSKDGKSGVWVKLTSDKDVDTSWAERERQVASRVKQASPDFAYDVLCSLPSAIVTDDLTGYQLLRKQLIDGDLENGLSVTIQRLALRLSKLHRSTHQAHLEADQFTQLQSTFGSSSVKERAIRASLVEPYSEESRNKDIAGDAHTYLTTLLAKPEITSAVEAARRLLEDKQECLIHGNLGHAAVMAKDGTPVLINLQYANVGPCAYDVGMLMAHYIIFYHVHMLTEQDNDAHRRVAYQMMDALNLTGHTYYETLTGDMNNAAQYKQTLISEVALFAGCELIRSVAGREMAPAVVDKSSAQLEILQSAERLLAAHQRITEVGRLAMMALMLC